MEFTLLDYIAFALFCYAIGMITGILISGLLIMLNESLHKSLLRELK